MPQERSHLLDLKDRKLLFALEKNARITNASLSQNIGLVPDVINYRINRLLAKEILKSFLCYINFSKLGYVAYALYLSTQSMTSRDKKHFVDFFSNHPYCTYFCECGGSYDYVVDMLAKNPLALMKHLTEINNRFGKVIHRQEIITRIHMSHFPKQYLLDATPIPAPSTYFGGDTDDLIVIDKIDDQILKILATNARMKMTTLAEQIGLSDTAVGQRIKRMEKLGLITGYIALIEPQMYGQQVFNLLLKLQNFRIADEEQLFEFCRKHRHITWLIRTLGSWDFEIAIEVNTQQELQRIVDQLKDHFSAIIQRIEFAPIFRTIKYNQYPFSNDCSQTLK